MVLSIISKTAAGDGAPHALWLLVVIMGGIFDGFAVSNNSHPKGSDHLVGIHLRVSCVSESWMSIYYTGVRETGLHSFGSEVAMTMRACGIKWPQKNRKGHLKG